MQISRRVLLTGAVAAAGLGAAGCGGPAAPPAGASGAGPTSAAASAPVSTAPAGVAPLRLGVPARALTRDPALAWDTESFRLTRQVCETLLGVDPDTGAPVPLLADAHEESSDGRTHTFRLAEGLRFSDGTACDAAAVVANITRWSTLPEPGQSGDAVPSAFVAAFGGRAGSATTAFVSVSAADERTVVLRLRRRLQHLAAALTGPAFGICAPGSWERTVRVGDADVLAPLGTGAYRWPEADDDVPALEGGELALVPNPLRREPADPVRPVVVRPLGRAATRLRELRRGTVDVIDVVAPGQLRPLVEAGTQVLPRDPFSVLYLGMNLDHPLMRRPYMRQAVAFAVDRPRLASSDVFLQGTSLAHDLVPPALGVADETARRYDVNPARARELLELAGYDDEPLELLYPAGTADPAMPEPERIVAMVAEDLGAVGIRLHPVPVPGDQDYLRTVLGRPGRALHLRGRTGRSRDPHLFLEPFVGSARAETGYANESVAEALQEAAGEQDDERRRELFRSAVSAMAIDLPALPLVYPISALATGRRISSYPTSPQLDEPMHRIEVDAG